MGAGSETEKYIHFRLTHLGDLNEHHTFEEICFQIALRRISSNVMRASGPVSAGGDQGRDAESYYTALPRELPGAGGFIGRATTEPLVIACTIKKDRLKAKIKGDLDSICGSGEPVERVAFFSAHTVPAAHRHELQEHARTTHAVSLEIFDGVQISHMLAEGDLFWVAQRYLDLPSNLAPVVVDEPQPEWYSATLTALRSRSEVYRSEGALSEVRDGLRHAAGTPDALGDLPEWLGYMREFAVAGANDDLTFRARYEIAFATWRGRNTFQDVEDDVRAALEYAQSSFVPWVLQDADTLLRLWGAAWRSSLATASADEIHDTNLRLRKHVAELIDLTEQSTHPIRKARLYGIAAQLCLHPRWPEVDQEQPGTLPTPRELIELRREAGEAGLPLQFSSDVPIDIDQAMTHLSRLVELLPLARVYPVGDLTEIFQMLTPALARDSRYNHVCEALDAAAAAVGGDTAVATTSRARALSWLQADRPLEALRELHTTKINLLHGDTLRGSLITMRLIARTYARLKFAFAAKQHALAAVMIATGSGDSDLHDILHSALVDAMDYSYAAGYWADSTALGHAAVLAHGVYAEQAFDRQAHPELERVDFHLLTPMLAAERYRPAALPVLKAALGSTGYETGLLERLDMLRPSFRSTEAEFAEQARQQLSGSPFSDFGSRRTLTFAGLGLAWTVTCSNSRETVLAAERLASAIQIMLADLAPADPAFVPHDVHVRVTVGTPHPSSEGNARVKMKHDRVLCSVVLSSADSVDMDALDHETMSTVTYILLHLTARGRDDFMALITQAFASGLTHKINSGRPYDEVAGILDNLHYDRVASTALDPIDATFRTTPAVALAAPVSPGPGYDHGAALERIRENYAWLPTLINRSLPRVLADPDTVEVLRQLRAAGWLDWHLLLALVNVAGNVRMRAAGVLSRPYIDRDEAVRLFKQPESADSEEVPLSEFTLANLQQQLQMCVSTVAQGRWKIPLHDGQPNLVGLKALLEARYGFRNDVPHVDLLEGALGEDGQLRPLLSS